MQQIQVLMSTYNGEKYLPEQLDSILNQKDVKVSILIRDDGSTDRTVEILKQYETMYDNVLYYASDNIGPQRSFFELITKADQTIPYFAFADQDDFWQTEKLIHAIDEIRTREQQNENVPVLYGSKVIYANGDLTTYEEFQYENEQEPSFGNALVENIFMGCTEVFNNALLESVILHMPTTKVWHDWWLYLVASCFGHVIYDNDAYILYRQHASNEIGMQNSWVARWKNRIKHFHNLKYSLSSQAKAFIEAYGCEYEQFEQVKLVAEYRTNWNQKLALLKNKNIYRQQKLDTKVYHVLFFFGLL